MAPAALSVVTIGWRAQAALAGGGEIRPLGLPSRPSYLTVAGELLWLGPLGASRHARAVLVDRLPDTLDAIVLELSRACAWRPAPLTPGEAERLVADATCRAVVRALSARGEAKGFGLLLRGRRLEGSLERAIDPARALARAFGEDDAAAAVAAAEELIGLGPGLTPAGDDFVGGAFFAHAVLAPATARGPGWSRAIARVRALASARTHPVSAVLLADLLAGEGYEPLHDLAAAVTTGALPTALAAADGLSRIGHSSGWDLLAGFLAGVLGLPAVAGIAAAASSAQEDCT